MEIDLEEQLRDYEKKIAENAKIVGFCAFFLDRVCNNGICAKQHATIFKCQAWDSKRDCCLRLEVG